MGVRQFLVQVVNTSDNKLISRRAYPHELGRVASLPEREKETERVRETEKEIRKNWKRKKIHKMVAGREMCGGGKAGSELR